MESGMGEFLKLTIIFIVALAIVAISTAIYRAVSFKALNKSKPRLVFFPKYIAKHELSEDELEASLIQHKFIKNENGTFSRGKLFGDFSINLIKLAVEINTPEKELKIYSSFFGILFDTGDLWQETTDILNVQTP